MATLCHPAQSKLCSNIQTSSLWGLNCPAPINTPSTFSDAVNIRDHKINLNHVVNECVDVTNDNHQAAGGVDGLVCVEEPRPAISYTGDTGRQAAHGPQVCPSWASESVVFPSSTFEMWCIVFKGGCKPHL